MSRRANYIRTAALAFSLYLVWLYLTLERERGRRRGAGEREKARMVEEEGGDRLWTALIRLKWLIAIQRVNV